MGRLAFVLRKISVFSEFKSSPKTSGELDTFYRSPGRNAKHTRLTLSNRNSTDFHVKHAFNWFVGLGPFLSSLFNTPQILSIQKHLPPPRPGSFPDAFK